MSALLTPIEVDLALERHHLGTLPYPLRVPSHGGTLAERGRLLDGLAERPYRRHWLTVLTGADLSIDSTFLPEVDASPVRAVAALRNRHAVIATQRDGTGISVREIPRDGLVPAILDLLPPGTRGTEKSVTLAPGTRPARTRPRLRGGQLAVNSRSDLRGRRRSPVLSWFDTETGRYLCQLRDGWTTIAPADTATLGRRLAEMVVPEGR